MSEKKQSPWVLVLFFASLAFAAGAGVTAVAKEKKSKPSGGDKAGGTASAGAPLNACGCYAKGSACVCTSKKAKCACPGECEPVGCAEKRNKQLEKETAAEVKRARDEDKKREEAEAKAEAQQAQAEEKAEAKRAEEEAKQKRIDDYAAMGETGDAPPTEGGETAKPAPKPEKRKK